ncbi:MAG: hypothetical protein Kow00121_46460 [Elainellaceae cyanobacterium]
MRLRRFSAIILALSAFIVSSCTVDRRKPQLDTQKFSKFDGISILCFDLSSDSDQPVGGLLLRIKSSPTSPSEVQRNILLPFQANQVVQNRDILLTSGAYDNQFTLINISIGSPSLGTPTVSFFPQLRTLSADKPSLSGLEPGVYFSKNGLERWFILIDDSPKILSELHQKFPGIEFDGFDSVAIAMPSEYEGRDVEPGSSIIPKSYILLGNIVAFSSPQNVQGNNKIVLRYAVPATPTQIAVSNGALKLIFVLVIPLVTLVFLDPNDIQNPRLRNVAISGFIILQILVAGVVIWAALTIRGPSPEAWVDFIIAGVGVVSEVVIILVKRERKPTPNPGA